MADINEFLTNTKSINEGEWIEVGNQGNTFHIKTKGATNAYKDYLADLQRLEVRRLNRTLKPGDIFYTAETLPPSINEHIQALAISEHCLLDVKGLERGKDKIKIDEFKELIKTNETLLFYALIAKDLVGRTQEKEREIAEKNS